MTRLGMLITNAVGVGDKVERRRRRRGRKMAELNLNQTPDQDIFLRFYFQILIVIIFVLPSNVLRGETDKELHCRSKRYAIRLWSTTARCVIFREPAIATGAIDSEV